VLAMGWTATGSSTRRSLATTMKACWPASMRRCPASWPGSTGLVDTGAIGNRYASKDSAHPARRRTARAHSSVEEHSPYKRRVRGSNPLAPTRSEAIWTPLLDQRGAKRGAKAFFWLMADASGRRRGHGEDAIYFAAD
jgi:hypothetical protein